MAFVVIATLAVSFVFVYNNTGSRLKSELDHDIRGSASQLARALTLPPDTSRVSSGSTLLVLIRLNGWPIISSAS